MTIRIDLLRPDDLLNLHIEGENLRLESGAPNAPALVLDDASKPGYLIVTFPPQTVVEEAVYESSPTRCGQRTSKVIRLTPFTRRHPSHLCPLDRASAVLADWYSAFPPDGRNRSRTRSRACLIGAHLN